MRERAGAMYSEKAVRYYGQRVMWLWRPGAALACASPRAGRGRVTVLRAGAKRPRGGLGGYRRSSVLVCLLRGPVVRGVGVRLATSMAADGAVIAASGANRGCVIVHDALWRCATFARRTCVRARG